MWQASGLEAPDRFTSLGVIALGSGETTRYLYDHVEVAERVTVTGGRGLAFRALRPSGVLHQEVYLLFDDGTGLVLLGEIPLDAIPRVEQQALVAHLLAPIKRTR